MKVVNFLNYYSTLIEWNINKSQISYFRGFGVLGFWGWPKDIHYAFFGNVVRGKSALFRLVVRNGFAHFVRKVFARRKLLPGKFWVFAPLAM